MQVTLGQDELLEVLIEHATQKTGLCFDASTAGITVYGDDGESIIDYGSVQFTVEEE